MFVPKLEGTSIPWLSEKTVAIKELYGAADELTVWEQTVHVLILSHIVYKFISSQCTISHALVQAEKHESLVGQQVSRVNHVMNR